MTRRTMIASAAAALAALAGGFIRPARSGQQYAVSYSDAEWRQRLTSEQYYVLRDSGTETAFSSPLNDEKHSGTYDCAACALALFSSSTKFDSGTGWPSFWAPLPNAVLQSSGGSAFFGTEVHCRQCGGHLGHVFGDGPKPTGLRYCINGVALKFKAA